MTHRVCVFGAGKIGQCVVNMLPATNDYQVHVVDLDAKNAQSSAQGLPGVTHQGCDFLNATAVSDVLKKSDYVISCAPFFCNGVIAKCAADLGVHYLDLTEDVNTSTAIQKMAQGSQSAFIPQSGLAPGYITIAASGLVKEFDEVFDVKMRVGALPKYPHNRLKYNLTWSTDGLINEYCNDCDIIEEGQFKKVPSLEGVEHFYIDGVEYEAFNTSGGLGSYAQTLIGKARNVNYKTLRYPGHRDLMCFLLEDLNFKNNREQLKKIFDSHIPYTDQDIVVTKVSVNGLKNNRLTEKSLVKVISDGTINNRHWGAIQITTAAGICAVLDLHAHKKIKQSGFVKQEDVNFEDFIQNRFGKYFDM